MRGVSITTAICSKPLILVLAQLGLAVFFWSFIMAYYGFVYVMENEIMPNVYKIGYTDRSPKQRADDLSNTSIPTPYEVVAYWEVENPMAHEKQLHNLLSDKRVAANREFFKLNDDDLLKIYSYICDYSYSQTLNYPLDIIVHGEWIKSSDKLTVENNNETNS